MRTEHASAPEKHRVMRHASVQLICAEFKSHLIKNIKSPK